MISSGKPWRLFLGRMDQVHFPDWTECAFWLKCALPFVRFARHATMETVATVFVKDDFNGEGTGMGRTLLFDMEQILRWCFGAYPSGPACTASGLGPEIFASFGFWNNALLTHARRVLPLPTDLRAGPITSWYPDSGNQEIADAFARAYNLRVEDLPRRPQNLPEPLA